MQRRGYIKGAQTAMKPADGAARVPNNLIPDSVAKGGKETEQQTQLREKLREFQEKKALRRQ